jgi:hypothetical protein
MGRRLYESNSQPETELMHPTRQRVAESWRTPLFCEPVRSDVDRSQSWGFA